jgi:hypothetical protein
MAGEGRDEQADLVAEMFAGLTGRLEDAAGIAAESQAPLPASVLRANAEHLGKVIAEAATLLARVAAMLGEAEPDSDHDVDHR